MINEYSKLHLGCGSRRLKGFINIDFDTSVSPDMVMMLHDLDGIENESIVEIYSSHSFEYYDRHSAISVLREWHRVLTPGGQIYLVVPDFEALISVYQKTGELRFVLGPLFGKWETQNGIIYHKTCWDYRDLFNLLNEAGFGSISKFNPEVYLKDIDSNYDDYSLAFFPHMDKSGIQVSLCLTAKKI